MRELISELKKKSIVDSSPFWKRLAVDLERPARNQRVVNLSRLNRYTKENETVVVPGKVLASGEIGHKLTIAAFSFSTGAVEKLKRQNCEMLLIGDLMKKNPKTSDIRIIG